MAKRPPKSKQLHVFHRSCGRTKATWLTIVARKIIYWKTPKDYEKQEKYILNRLEELNFEPTLADKEAISGSKPKQEQNKWLKKDDDEDDEDD